MKMRNVLCSIVAVGLLAGLAAGCATEKQKHAKLAAQAKITRADAERIALVKAPGGTIKEGELEKEKGKLIWSFDIATPGTRDLTEVAVDALTGEVVATEKEAPADEVKEKKGEEKQEK